MSNSQPRYYAGVFILRVIGYTCLKEILLETKEAHTQSSPKNYIHGIGELAKFLKCSRPTAQRYKNGGKIPYSQTGRKIVFDAEEVLKAMQRKGGAK